MFRVRSNIYKVKDERFKGLRVQGSELRVQGLGSRV